MLVLRRGAVDVDDELVVGVIHRLERRAWGDVDQSARRNVAALRRIAEVHRQRPREDDERLLLDGMPVSPPLGARLVAPDVGARVCEAGELAQLGDVAGRLTGLVWPRQLLEVAGIDGAPEHAATLVTGSQ